MQLKTNSAGCGAVILNNILSCKTWLENLQSSARCSKEDFLDNFIKNMHEEYINEISKCWPRVKDNPLLNNWPYCTIKLGYKIYIPHTFENCLQKAFINLDVHIKQIYFHKLKELGTFSNMKNFQKD